MKVPILVPNIFDHPFTYESGNIDLKLGDYVLIPFYLFYLKKRIMVRPTNFDHNWDNYNQKALKFFQVCLLMIFYH